MNRRIRKKQLKAICTAKLVTKKRYKTLINWVIKYNQYREFQDMYDRYGDRPKRVFLPFLYNNNLEIYHENARGNGIFAKKLLSLKDRYSYAILKFGCNKFIVVALRRGSVYELDSKNEYDLAFYNMFKLTRWILSDDGATVILTNYRGDEANLLFPSVVSVFTLRDIINYCEDKITAHDYEDIDGFIGIL